MKPNFIFGIRAILEAIRAGKEVEKILVKRGASGDLYKELLDTIKQYNLPFQWVPIEKLNRLTQKNHQGAIAFMSLIEYQNMEEVLIRVYENGEIPFLLILDGITDVRNFGAIARSASCAGVHAIIVPDKGSAIINGDAIKTSAGALHDIPVCRVKNITNSIEYLQESGVKMVCATEKGNTNFFDADLKGPIAIIMGSEDEGISNSIIRKADLLCKIPIQGPISSLNVSVATGVLLFEVIRQRVDF
ncbi:MAG: 23S rRNA (guanosine(2251)-2'-O)-methyltransferase RlmB [Marinilabiliaceae bacterium]|nr:23S rRNA (guanosine(2251)-2'-O)-methyltransferase RlmB [Marinilabiliaceae bacterium]